MLEHPVNKKMGLHSTVLKAEKELQEKRNNSKKVRSVDFKKADNGGYVAETRHEGYDVPTKTTIHMDAASAAKHLSKVMPC